MKYLDLAIANETIKTTDIKGKEYAEVNQRIKAFRMVYPQGTIDTEMLSNENGVCIFKASVYDDEYNLLATGTAYEKENSTFINKTSYIENCETSAVGRALGMAGFGIDVSVASAEEVTNAINNQEATLEDAEKWTFSYGKHKGETMREVLENDYQYVKWYITNKANDYDNKCYEFLTGEHIPTEEESMERIALINKLNELVDETECDYEALLTHYEVESNNQMTISQLKEVTEKLEKRLEK